MCNLKSKLYPLKSQNGAQLVEFAIILPLLITILFAVIEFGFMLYDQAIITNASREGARAGVVAAIQGSGFSSYPGCASATSGITDGTATAGCVAKNYVSNSLVSFYSPAPTAIITATNIGPCTPLPPSNACKLQVNITYNYKGPVTSAISSIMGTIRTLQATSIMYYE
jgi:Flp pilus assembly protein TadG